MAKHYSLLLFFIALTILNVCSISATSSSSPFPSFNKEVDAIIQALLCESSYEAELCESHFTIWAKLLNISKTQLVLPIKGTMFVPTDAAISHSRYATDLNAYTIPYHITPKHLLFSDLYNLEPLSLLPTLVPSKTFFITKTILNTKTLHSSYKVDNAVITHPNIYISSQLVVHGIDHVLDLHPQRSSMPPLFRAGNVLGARISPAPA